MRIRDYVGQIQHAVDTVIGILHIEHDRVEQARDEARRLTRATRAGYSQADAASALASDFDDDPLFGTAIHWETYFGVDKERFHKEQAVASLGEVLLARELSLGALAGSLLQYGKQGIALQYGRKRTGCPGARIVGPASLSDLIWLGRNQALHWEDGKFNDDVEACFEKLAAFDPAFAAYKTRSMGYEVVALLGWRTFAEFERDLLLLGGSAGAAGGGGGSGSGGAPPADAGAGGSGGAGEPAVAVGRVESTVGSGATPPGMALRIAARPGRSPCAAAPSRRVASSPACTAASTKTSRHPSAGRRGHRRRRATRSPCAARARPTGLSGTSPPTSPPSPRRSSGWPCPRFLRARSSAGRTSTARPGTATRGPARWAAPTCAPTSSSSTRWGSIACRGSRRTRSIRQVNAAIMANQIGMTTLTVMASPTSP